MLRSIFAGVRCSRNLLRACSSNGIHYLKSRGVETTLPKSLPLWPSNRSTTCRREITTTSIKRQVLPSSHHTHSTIYALSTGTGRAGIAIVRISGPACSHIYASLCPNRSALRPRYATLRTLYHPIDHYVILDSEALVLHFPSPNTVTGEDMLELHIHGGSATIKAVLSAISQIPSISPIRYAEAGEFTRRAFQNNRLDLAQVEALSDTLSAETEQQRRAAIVGNSGDLGRTYEAWRSQLLLARGEVEAFIDFYEDQGFDEGEAEMLQSIEKQIRAIQSSIVVHVEAGKRGELLRNGIRISMLGAPNAGKSSLMNRIVGREASIVSSEAGTTRDIVEVSLDIEGYLCTFADTAGLRSDTYSSSNNATQAVVGAIEAEGIKRAKAKAHESDLIIAFVSIEQSPDRTKDYILSYDPESLEIALKAPEYLVVVNKIDLLDDCAISTLLQTFASQHPSISPDRLVLLSLNPSFDIPTIPDLLSHLSTCLVNLTSHPSQDLYGVTARQSALLGACNAQLEAYLVLAAAKEDMDVVLAAEYLRGAALELGRITGRGEGGDVEEVLGVVFEKFCVGK